MKILKKINKGFILTLIVVVALYIYIANVEKRRKIEIIEIDKVCNQVIDYTNKYLILPENMRILGKKPSQLEIDKYKEELKSELKKIMIENESAIELQYNIFVSELEKNFNDNRIVTEMSRTITDKPTYEFDGEQVKVTIKSKVSKSEKYQDGGEEKINQKSFETYNDQITLQKVNGKWKVIFVNFEFNQLGSTDIIEL